MRILVTENCNAKCPNCFNAQYRSIKEISITIFEQLCKYLNANKVRQIKIMGGEPSIHSQFEDIIHIAMKYFHSVIIFTNAKNERIKNIKPRQNDYITYNFKFIDTDFDISKLLIDYSGRRSFEIQISSDTDISVLISKMNWIYSNVDFGDKFRFNLTLNCIENIFYKQQVISEKWNAIVDFIENKLKLNYNIDHNIPICFSDNNIKVFRNCRLCSVSCAGLIDANLNLRYCNQFEDKLLNIKSGDKFVDFNILLDALLKAYQIKLRKNYNNKCSHCDKFKVSCNGGCFMHKY